MASGNSYSCSTTSYQFSTPEKGSVFEVMCFVGCVFENGGRPILPFCSILPQKSHSLLADLHYQPDEGEALEEEAQGSGLGRQVLYH